MGYASSFRTGSAEMDSLMQEQTLSLLYEQYAALGSWDRVRMWSAEHLSGTGGVS